MTSEATLAPTDTPTEQSCTSLADNSPRVHNDIGSTALQFELISGNPYDLQDFQPGDLHCSDLSTAQAVDPVTSIFSPCITPDEFALTSPNIYLLPVMRYPPWYDYSVHMAGDENGLLWATLSGGEMERSEIFRHRPSQSPVSTWQEGTRGISPTSTPRRPWHPAPRARPSTPQWPNPTSGYRSPCLITESYTSPPEPYDAETTVSQGLKEISAYQCKWDVAGSPCGRHFASDKDSISLHLEHRHDVDTKGVVDCMWTGCAKRIRGDSLSRHIQRHIGVKGPGSRGTKKATRAENAFLPAVHDTWDTVILVHIGMATVISSSTLLLLS
ncbi:hypothetical protein BV22DRAFT_911318 [Leucogyrophana mollusca]|uniref:Uncharacterized protein n=1 Tax=Leucogyrophana mollusca TaxID=85980 RepID=A0ACB8AZM6_9AGAM|nr:hypothetical protein BV22DRAFT_911318 [Leucogyrophana mollusca]